jgi:hypothetical protein
MVALVIIYRNINLASSPHPLFMWATVHWIPMALAGFVLCMLLSIADYYGNPKVFDRLDNEYARKAVSSVKQVRDIKADVSIDADLHISTRQSELTVRSLSHEDMDKNQILSLDPATFLRVVVDVELQRKLSVLDPILHFLSQVQLAVALSVGFGTAAAAGLLFLSHFSPNINLSEAKPAIVAALSFWAIYPLLFSYWSAEVAWLTDRPVNNLGYMLVGFLILVLAALIAMVDPSVRDVAAGLGKALPILMAVIGLGAVKVVGLDKLRYLVGVDANVATRLTVIAVLAFIGLIVCSMLIIQHEEALRAKEIT